MDFLKLNFSTRATILDGFTIIAQKISKEIKLKINSSYYRITDFEFYTSSVAMPDPHTHKDKLQLENGKIYLHSSGIDITFGDNFNYGGILIRSVIKLYDGALPEAGYMKMQFNGPQVVATELFSNLYPLDSNEKNEISLIELKEDNTDLNFCLPYKIFNTKRVGLMSKITDTDDFYKNLELRYVVILPKFLLFKQTVNGIENIIKEQINKNQISNTEVLYILGYNMNLLVKKVGN